LDIYIARIPTVAIYAAGLTAVAIGWWRLGRDGRVVASIALFQMVRARLDMPGVEPIVTSTAWGVTEGAVTLAINLWLVLRGRNYWTVWPAAVAVLSLMTDLLRIAPGLTDWSFYSAQIAWFLVLCASLLVAALLPSSRASPHHAPVV